MLNIKKRDEFSISIKKEYEEIRENYLKSKSGENYISIVQARLNKPKFDWTKIRITKPKVPGITVLKDFPLENLRKYINWTQFFLTWELKGKYPAIFKNPKIGVEAQKLFDDANSQLDVIISNNQLKANGIIGLFPANSVADDDIEIYSDDSRSGVLIVIHTLRQQIQKTDGSPNLALADYIAPNETHIEDYIGLFAVSAGFGVDELVEKYKKENDDYLSIMTKVLADRLAEAFAEHLHELVRKEYWGYSLDENLRHDEILKEQYQGIRPAPGYPSLPDHTEKQLMFDILHAEKNTGIKLSETYMMLPAASVCGLYFAHPESKYFPVGKINRDQVLDYRKRKGMSIELVEKWLSPNLGY